MLEVDNVDTFYGQFQALREVSLKVGEGELVALFGPNGHGKSTLLKTICGLLTPKRGCVKLGGVRINGLATPAIIEMGLVYIAEARHLFPEMTVLENLRLGAYSRKARPYEGKNLQYVLELFPRLKERLHRLASTLSGGEARMLAIGRGLMSCAKILAIDEPSLGLAPNLTALVFEKIGEINRKGISVLLVEQNFTHASRLASRFYLMEDGKIVLERKREEALCDAGVKRIFLGL